MFGTCNDVNAAIDLNTPEDHEFEDMDVFAFDDREMDNDGNYVPIDTEGESWDDEGWEDGIDCTDDLTAALANVTNGNFTGDVVIHCDRETFADGTDSCDASTNCW